MRSGAVPPLSRLPPPHPAAKRITLPPRIPPYIYLSIPLSASALTYPSSFTRVMDDIIRLLRHSALRTCSLVNEKQVHVSNSASQYTSGEVSKYAYALSSLLTCAKEPDGNIISV